VGLHISEYIVWPTFGIISIAELSLWLVKIYAVNVDEEQKWSKNAPLWDT